jgi:hypothetical protein
VIRVPRWAAWLDALAILLVLVAVKIAVSTGIRFSLVGQLITVRDPWRPFLLAALLLTVRHWRVPRPNVLQRAATGVRWLRTEPVASVARAWAISRFGVLIVGLFAALIIGRPPTMEYQVSMDPVADLPARWDAAWYVAIARDGYRPAGRRGQAAQQPIAFFPAFPLLIRGASVFTEPRRERDMTYDRYVEVRDSRLMWAGSLIAVATFFAALLALYRWTETRSSPESAITAVMLLAAYPFAVFYSAPYTESLFLLATVGACLAFERRRWGAAALSGLLAGLTRPNGAMLSLTLGLLAVAPLFARDREWAPRRVVLGLLVAAMPGIGMLLYSAYIYSLTGDPFAWMKVQEAWGRSFRGSRNYVDWVAVTVWSDGVLAWVTRAPVEFIQTVASLFALGMTWPVWRRFGAPYAVFMIANLLPPLLKGGPLSMGRMTSTLFPMFAALALAIPAQRQGAWLLFFALCQGLMAAIFFTWRPVY